MAFEIDTEVIVLLSWVNLSSTGELPELEQLEPEKFFGTWINPLDPDLGKPGILVLGVFDDVLGQQQLIFHI